MNPIEQVSETWKRHWEESGMRPDLSLRGRVLRHYLASMGGMSSTRYVLSVLKRELGEVKGLEILDAGSGTGLNSLALSARGASITLLDISPRALEIAKVYYDEQKLLAKAIEGSIFSLPFADESFDVVWNTGVIEHFEPEDRKRALKDMLRVMKPKGALITLNPYAYAKIYRYAKEIAEKRGTWDVGFELPIDTLGDDIDLDRYILTERAEGWFLQFHFLKYLLPGKSRILFVAFHEFLQNFLNFLNRYPGYLLTSVIRRRT